jgi:two-component system chemotaxis response regulator CheY
VEDDPSIAEVMELVLAEDGYAVTSARDGGEALAAAKRGRFGLVLLDLLLPGIAGDDLLSALRPHLGATPVLVITAARDGATRARASSVAGYLPKPFDVDALLAYMAELYCEELTL